MQVRGQAERGLIGHMQKLVWSWQCIARKSRSLTSNSINFACFASREMRERAYVSWFYAFELSDF
jgi:hypothetical protein